MIESLRRGPTITDVTAFPYWPSSSPKPLLAVRVRTTDGLTGWGESGFTFRERAVCGAVEHLRDLVIGRDSFRIGALWQEMYRRHYFEGCRATSAAMSAIDVALHDIKGQALGVPVYQLLGGRQRDIVPCFATTTGEDLAAMVASAQALASRGFDSVRLHILPVADHDRPKFEPRQSIAQTADAVRAVRETLGSKVFLGIDYHHRLSVAEAASFCQRLPAGTLDFIEEPIRSQLPEAYLRLRAMTDVPFAVGEELTSKWEFQPFIEQRALDFARIDVATVGGLTEALKVAAWCEAHYIDVMPHNPLGAINTAATLHFAAALPNFDVLEARRHHVWDPLGLDGHLFPEQAVMTGAAFPIPDRPGLGLKVDEPMLAEESKRYRLGHTDRLIRTDGSLTNA